MRDQALLDKFGKHAAALRAAAGLTQQRVADRMGVRPEAVSQIESGKLSPTLSTIVALAHALGVAPSALLDFESVPVAQPEGADEVELLADYRALGEADRVVARSVTHALRK
ncbi:MAG: helix-turn-helix transcriptional regulator [Myxococcota bacterium]